MEKLCTESWWYTAMENPVYIIGHQWGEATCLGFALTTSRTRDMQLWRFLRYRSKQMLQNTLECCYNAVQFTTILPLALGWQWQTVNQILNSQQPPHISPSRTSAVVSIVRIWEKLAFITVPHCSKFGSEVRCFHNQRGLSWFRICRHWWHRR